MLDSEGGLLFEDEEKVMQHLSDINYEGWSAQRLKVEQLSHPLSDQFSATQHTVKLSPMKVFKSLTVLLRLREGFNKKNPSRNLKLHSPAAVNNLAASERGKLCVLSKYLPKIKISHRKKRFQNFPLELMRRGQEIGFFRFQFNFLRQIRIFFIFISPLAAWANEPIFYIFDTQPHARLFHYSHQKERECRARPRS